MGSKFSFTIFFFFLSWALQGFSQETQSMDLTQSLDSLGGILQQAQQQSVAAAAVQGGGSGDSLPCMQKLIPCQPYMHSPSPPATCCSPLRDVVNTDSQCLCQVFNNPEILKSFNLTLDEAMALPKHCGIQVDTSVCKKANSPAASPTTPTTPSDPGSSTSNSSDSTNSSSSSNAGVRIVDAAALPFGFIAFVAALMFSAF